MYPLKFNPILKSVIWGGNRIATFKNISTALTTIGESWELSEVKEDVSIVANGDLINCSLSDIIASYSSDLTGRSDVEKFPLLVKFIDARDNLSIQVHPNDEIAKIRHQSLGKTEMWYVIDAEPNAFLYSGFTRSISKSEYEARVKDSTLVEVLQKHFVKAGDVFFLPAGRVHAIGKGIFVAEIQQNSDITYRIFDYNRTDANGNMRQLHTELAKDVLELEAATDLRITYAKSLDRPINLVDCNYFVVNLLTMSCEISRNLIQQSSFVIYLCTSGKALLRQTNGTTITISKGETVLIPAQIANTTIVPLFECELLECYLPLSKS